MSILLCHLYGITVSDKLYNMQMQSMQIVQSRDMKQKYSAYRKTEDDDTVNKIQLCNPGQATVAVHMLLEFNSMPVKIDGS